MNKDYYVQLNIQDDFDKHIGVVKLNEVDSIVMHINLVQNGNPFDLSTASYVTMAVIKPDGNFNNGYCEIVDGPSGKVEYTLPVNCVNQTGVFRGEVQAFNNTSMISTAAFSYEVKNSLLRDEGVTTQPEYPILVQLIEDVQEAVDAEVLRVTAESGRVSAESSRVTAESARVSAESTRATNESTRQSQETARVSAESARVTAESGRVTAESARVSAENTRVSQESTRQSNESSRVTAESGRVTAESNRVTAENARVSAESARASNESTRISNESGRVTAESTRVTEFQNILDQWEAIQEADVRAEVIAARNEYATLDARLDASDVILNASKSEIETARNGEASLDARLDKIDKIQSPTGPTALSFGNNTITKTTDSSSNADVTFTPMHYVDILGKIGNCEDVSKWTAGQSTLTLDTSKKVFGANAIKITIVSGTVGSMYIPISSFDMSPSKYYVLSAYLDKGTSTNANVSKDPTGGGVLKVATTTATTMTRVAIKIQPSDINASNYLSAYINGIVGQYGYVDGIQIDEITSTEYTNDSESVLMARYPYTDSIATTINPALEITHADGSKTQSVVEGEFLTGDTLSITDGQVTGSKLWKNRTLFGKKYAWSFSTDYAGYKTIFAASTLFLGNAMDNTDSTQLAFKYDSKKLVNGNATITAGDQITKISGNMVISILDTDTGFAESINPNDDEVKAFMNGWKATANNGTRYTAWVSVVDGTTTPTVQSIDYVKINIAPNYEGYKLYYKLSTAQPINEGSDSYIAPLKGDIPRLETGANTVNFDTGIVIDEIVIPAKGIGSSSNVNTFINTNYMSDAAWGTPDTRLRYKAKTIKKIYKNGVDDTSNWTIATPASTYSNGSTYAYTSNTIDTNATYALEYEILDEIAPQISSATLTYKNGLVDAVNGLYNAMETKQNKSFVVDTLIDLSVYEKVTAMWQAPSVYHSSGVMYLVINIPISRKIAKPFITLTDWRINVGGGASALTDIKASGLGKVGSITATSLMEISVRFDITDATTITNIKTNGIQVGASFIADCRGVI